MKDNFRVERIINTYGVLPQLKYFQSEVFELSEAIIFNENDLLFKNCKGNIKHICEEIADIMVMLEQFKLFYGIDSEDITKIFWEKVDRQNKRIDKEENRKEE